MPINIVTTDQFAELRQNFGYVLPWECGLCERTSACSFLPLKSSANNLGIFQIEVA